jgi:diaminopropionate ammonia-lyase
MVKRTSYRRGVCDLERAMAETESPATLLRHCPAYAATPLLDLPALAAALGVAGVLIKDEGRRPLGSFKALGGTYAGLRALARAAGFPAEALLEPAGDRPALPALVCASAGNHGLSVAAAARLAGTRARVFMSETISAPRAARIAAKGAEVVRVPGGFDDAVRAAIEAARAAGDLLIPDTSNDPGDPVVADVMAGYGVIAGEIRAELAASPRLAPMHLFVQAGVGGLAAAMTAGLCAALAPPAKIVVVEPESAACVAAGLRAGRPARVEGSVESSAEMLACGEASAPALAVLLRHDVEALAVAEPALRAAPAFLREHNGPATTPSGATGLAGLSAALADPRLAARFALTRESRVLLVVSESAPA